MAVIQFLRSGPGRAVRVVIGFALIYYGATHASLFGLVLMMAGMVPAITGLAGVCLLDELMKAREAEPAVPARPHEGRV